MSDTKGGTVGERAESTFTPSGSSCERVIDPNTPWFTSVTGGGLDPKKDTKTQIN